MSNTRRAKGKNMPQQSGPPEGVPFPWAPVPVEYSFLVMTMGDTNAIVMTQKSPDTMMTTFWGPDDLEGMFRKGKEAIMTARTSLILPQSNGQAPGGITDLGQFRDQHDPSDAEVPADEDD